MRRHHRDPQEHIPLSTMSTPRSMGTRGQREVEVDMADLPSRRIDDRPFNTQRVPLRRRTWTQQRTLRTTDVVDGLPSWNAAGMSDGPSMAAHIASLGRRSEPSGLEYHAAQIVGELEKDRTLMQDNPASEQLRMETLREMPESLTLKRSIRQKLVKTVSQKSKRLPLGLWKRAKYSVSMSATKFHLAVKNLLYSCELWYQGLKVIEGHFGSGVATYFKFFRWLFILDVIVCIMSVSFVVVPQLIYRFYEPIGTNLVVDDGQLTNTMLYEDINTTDLNLVSVTPLPVMLPILPPSAGQARRTSHFSVKLREVEQPFTARADPYEGNAKFSLANIFTGEGFFTNTTLYYGYYTNESLHVSTNSWYSIPNAYFFTASVCSLFLFITLSISMARSYRSCFIETGGGLKNVYAHKVFCGWDFSIATSEAAHLKSKSIFNELKELLGDATMDRAEWSFKALFNMLAVQVSLNILCMIIISGTAVLMWFLLDNHVQGEGDSNGEAMLVSIVVTTIMMLSPILFSWFLRFEGYRNPRTALYVTLLRTFLLEAVIVGVLVAFWLQQSNTGCWETSLGQEAYRLILMDFIFTIIGMSLVEFIHSKICRSIWPGIEVPEFDIASNTLNLIYNQTLFGVGAFFSPLLSVMIVIKMFITFYIKKYCLLKNCQPSSRSWRAAQTQTVFLVLSFLSMFGVVITYVYIMTNVPTSNTCGPFRDYKFIYQMVLEGVFQLEDNNKFLKVIMFLLKPGVVAGFLLAMCVGVYYLRAKSHARMKMVELLREMLVLEAKDKEFLLGNISKVTEGRWMYNLPHSRPNDSNAPCASGDGSSVAGGDRPHVDPLVRGSNSSASHDGRRSGDTTTSDRLSSTDSVGPYVRPHRSGTPVNRLHQVRSNTSMLPSSSSEETLHSPTRSDGSILPSDDGLNDYEGSRIRNMRKKHLYRY